MIFKSLIFLILISSIGCEKSESFKVNVPPVVNTPVVENTPETVKATSDLPEKKEITCTEVELVGMWHELQKDEDVQDQIIDEGRDGDCSNFIKIGKRIDLDGDGIEEVFVEGSGSWGAVSTLPIWVLQKEGSEFRVILREQGESYSIEKNKSNGYHDLFFPSRRSVTSTTLSRYGFNDGKYQRVGCKIEFENVPKKLKRIVDCSDEKGIEKAESEFH